MRIHTSLTRDQIIDAFSAVKVQNRAAEHVIFKRLTNHRSTQRPTAFEVQLEAQERDRGRRAGNSGSYGSMIPKVDGFAATYDEWGWLLAALFALDSDIIVGSPKAPIYDGAVHFHHKTGMTYAPDALIWEINHGGDPYPYFTGRSVIGRRGANRVGVQVGLEYEVRRWPVTYAPRTVASVQRFAAGVDL